MPAVVRGAGRSSAKARSKSSSSPQKSRTAPGKPGAAASAPLPLSPRLVAVLGAAVVVLAVAVVLGTNHRGERLAAAVGDAALDETAKLGFSVQAVRLSGASPQSAPDILAAAAVPKGAPIFGVDLDAVRRRVEAVGWVKSARVMRLLPDSVLISVDERKLVAVWEHDGRTAVVDANGDVAAGVDPSRFASLPLVVGAGANLAAADILPHVLSRPRLAQRLDALVRVDGRRWDLRLKGGTIVELPSSDEESALIRLDQLDQQSRILDLGFARIDLRDPQMVLVRPRQASGDGAGAAGLGVSGSRADG